MPFVAYDLSIELIGALKPVVAKIAMHDGDLARQIRTAGTSAPLNLAEGARRVGKDRLHLWRVAAGSVAEVKAALAVAVAWGYVDRGEGDRAVALCDRLGAITWSLTR